VPPRIDAEVLLDHLERRLGVMQSATSIDDVGRLGRIHVLRFADTPARGAVTFATMGLSRAELHRGPDDHMRLELMLSLRDSPDPTGMAESVLPTLVEHLTDTGLAPRPGEVHHFGPLVEGTVLEGFALVPPARFDEGFGLLELGDAGVRLGILELIPLAAVEAGFVRRYGWDAFADVIGRLDPDFLDLHRPVLLRRVEGEDESGDRYFQPDGAPAP
jgi:hypothetical protein